jgi:hypothetical protein
MIMFCLGLAGDRHKKTAGVATCGIVFNGFNFNATASQSRPANRTGTQTG